MALLCGWRMASLAQRNLGNGRQLGYLLPGIRGGGGGGCNFSTTTFGSQLKEHSIQSKNHSPVLSSMAPYLLIAKEKEEAAAAAAANGGGLVEYCFYSLGDRRMVSLNNVIPDGATCVGSSHGWLAYVRCEDQATVFLTNPLSPLPHTIRLPSLKTLLTTIDSPSKRLDSPSIDNLVMSFPPLGSHNNDCTVMAIVDTNSKSPTVAFCKVGDSSWTALDSREYSYPGELAYSPKDGLFYSRCLDEGPLLEAWNLRNPCSPRRIDIVARYVRGTPPYPDSELRLRGNGDMILHDKEYLVMDSHSGDVLLVTRNACNVADDGTITDFWNKDHLEKYQDNLSMSTVRFDVCRLNASRIAWDCVTDLSDGVLFVGLNQCFHLSSRDFPPGVLIPNSIYFTADNHTTSINDTGIYNMKDFTVKSLFPSHLHELNDIVEKQKQHHSGAIHNQPMWFTPNP